MLKHGKEKCRVWCVLYLAIDVATHEIITAEMNLDGVIVSKNKKKVDGEGGISVKKSYISHRIR